MRRVSFKTGSTDRHDCSTSNSSAGVSESVNVNKNRYLHVTPVNLLHCALSRAKHLCYNVPVSVDHGDNHENSSCNVNANGVEVASNMEGFDSNGSGGGGGVNSFVRSARL